MTRVTIQHSPILQGVIDAPPSKSQAIRALIFALLAKGESTLEGIEQFDDLDEAIRTIESLGAQVTQTGSSLKIKGQGLPLKPSTSTLLTGNSGITTRFILPLLGLRAHPDEPMIVDCADQLRARPHEPLFQALRNLGLQIRTLDKPGTFPIEVSGQLKGAATKVSGVTSQYLSALLIALPLVNDDSSLQVDHLNEKSYVDLTLEWLQRQGIKIASQVTGSELTVNIGGNQHYQPFHYQLPGDYSAASNFLAAGALSSSEITVRGLHQNDSQGDKYLIEILKEMGAQVSINKNSVTVKGGKNLKGIKVDANQCPDLLPILAVLATQANGQTLITNVPQARLKETDRIRSMCENLKKMGARIQEQSDGLVIEQSTLQGASLRGYGDHRTVMALSLAGLLAQDKTEIDEAESINKTFPNYFKLLQSIGGKLEVSDVAS